MGALRAHLRGQHFRPLRFGNRTHFIVHEIDNVEGLDRCPDQCQFGLAFEGYGPVGETRDRDLAGRRVETVATFPDGSSGAGLEGLRAFMRTRGQAEFVDTLCRQLLVYALGRSLLQSDEPLVADMRKDLSSGGYKFDALVQDIVTSRQFTTKRATPSSPRNSQ